MNKPVDGFHLFKMQGKIVSFLFALIFLQRCSEPKKETVAFQSIIESTLEAHPDAIGILVHVEAPEQFISWSGSAGHSNWEKTEPIESEQPALIASITKNYVAVAILRLVEQGQLKLDQTIAELLSEKTADLMRQYHFEVNHITVAHLLSHKSGIPGYTGTVEFQNKITTHPTYRWTRDEQIALAIIQGPQNPPETSFHYTDTNYLLLSEILEQTTSLTFYTAIKELIGYEKLGLNETWFYTLEPIPEHSKPLIHQYVPDNNEDSYAIDNSFDLYGGGGIAATTEDLGRYAYHVFQGNVFDNAKTLELMFTNIPAGDSMGDEPCTYLLGIQECDLDGLNSYWHDGYWGTIFRYFPDLNASVVLYVVNQKTFSTVEIDIMKQITEVLKQ